MITLDVRLVPVDNRPHSGRIEVFFNNEWGQVCFQENSATLSVVCTQLGYGSAGVTPFSASVPGNARVWFSNNINCTGREDTLFDCLSPLDIANVGKTRYGYCSGGGAGVICPMCEFYIASYLS